MDTVIELEDIMLSETSQAQKDTHYIMHLHVPPTTVKFRKIESRSLIPREADDLLMG